MKYIGSGLWAIASAISYFCGNDELTFALFVGAVGVWFFGKDDKR